MKVSNIIQMYNLTDNFKEISYLVKVEIYDCNKLVNRLYYYVERICEGLYEVKFNSIADEKTLKYFFKLKTVHFDDFILAKEYAVKKMKKLKQYLENAKNN